MDHNWIKCQKYIESYFSYLKLIFYKIYYSNKYFNFITDSNTKFN